MTLIIVKKETKSDSAGSRIQIEHKWSLENTDNNKKITREKLSVISRH